MRGSAGSTIPAGRSASSAATAAAVLSRKLWTECDKSFISDRKWPFLPPSAPSSIVRTHSRVRVPSLPLRSGNRIFQVLSRAARPILDNSQRSGRKQGPNERGRRWAGRSLLLFRAVLVGGIVAIGLIKLNPTASGDHLPAFSRPVLFELRAFFLYFPCFLPIKPPLSLPLPVGLPSVGWTDGRTDGR